MKTPKRKKNTEYRIVKYPDKSSNTGVVFFVDRKVKKRFLFIPYYRWETVKWEDGTSIHWYDFTKCTKDVKSLKEGKKIYK